MERPKPNQQEDLLTLLAMNWLLALESDDPFAQLQKLNPEIDKSGFTRVEMIKRACEIKEATDGGEV